jgi:hypothetical protein
MIYSSIYQHTTIHVRSYYYICVCAHTTSPVGLSWTAEMFGYVFAASELGIRHEVRSLLALLVQKYKY